MASQFKIFGAPRGQRGASSTGNSTFRGRGSATRGSQHNTRGGSTHVFKPGDNPRGRGRGAVTKGFRSRGRGAGAGATRGGSLSTATPQSAVPTPDNYQERYEQLKSDRAAQRKKAIKDGHMADPDQPTALNKAIRPVGTCTTMCPEFESIERIVQKMVDKKEKYLDPETGIQQNSTAMMLKRFRRSAAGYEEQLPSDIRTPYTLLQTTNYLIRYIIGGEEPLGIIHKFVWDRTRSIRNDFSVQQVTKEHDVKLAVICLERIARFHIVSLHLLCSPENTEPFDRHQEREQLNNTMLSLMYYYDDNRERIHFPCEDEFRAYYILFSIHDQRPDLEVRVQRWPMALLNSPRVQIALELYAASGNTWESSGALDARRPNAIAQGFYSRFFNLIDSPSVSYLTACVAEIYFSQVRQTAIRSIWKGYRRLPVSQQAKNEDWTLSELTRVLHFDNEDQTIQFCEEQDLQLKENASGQIYLDWAERNIDAVPFAPSSTQCFSNLYVESKRVGRSLPAIILGMNIREAAAMGMIDQDMIHCGSEISVSPSMESFPLEGTDPSPSAFESATLPGPTEQVIAPTPFVGSSSHFSGLRPSEQKAESTISDEKATPPLSSSPFRSLIAKEPKASTGVALPAAGESIFPPPSFSFASSNPAPDQKPIIFPAPTGEPMFPASQSPFGSFKPSEPSEQVEKPTPSTLSAESSSNPFASFKPLAPIQKDHAEEKATTSTIFSNPSSNPFTSFKRSEPIDTAGVLPSTGTSIFPPASNFSFASFKPSDQSQNVETISSTTSQAASSNPFAASLSSFKSSEPAKEADVDSEPANPFKITAKSTTPNQFAVANSALKPSGPKADTNASPGSLFNRVTTPAASPFLSSSSPPSFIKPSESKEPSGTLPSSTGKSLFTSPSSSFATFQPSEPQQNINTSFNSATSISSASSPSFLKPSQSSQTFNPPPASTGQAERLNPFAQPVSSSNRAEDSKEGNASNESLFPGTLPSTEQPPSPFLSSVPFAAFTKPSEPQKNAGTSYIKQKQAFSPPSFSSSSSSGSFKPLEPSELAGSAAQSVSNRVTSPERTTTTPFQASTSSASSFSGSTFSRSHGRIWDDLYPSYETEEEERAAWQRLINSTVAKRARKRAREEEAQPQPRHTAPKVSEVARKKEPRKELQLPVISNMASVSDRAADAVKEAAAAAHKRMVDEDEVLLTAARIVAEQLRTGPSIFEGYRRTR